MDTAPLPPAGHGWDHPDDAVGPVKPVDPDAPTERLVPVGADRPRVAPTRAGPVLRAVEILAGLLSGGLLVLGVALLVLQFAAPDLAPGTGLGAASGPGWARIAGQLGVGVLGELTVLARRRVPASVRWPMAAVVIIAAAGVLWLAWWA